MRERLIKVTCDRCKVSEVMKNPESSESGFRVVKFPSGLAHELCSKCETLLAAHRNKVAKVERDFLSVSESEPDGEKK